MTKTEMHLTLSVLGKMTFKQAKGTSVACYRLEEVKNKLIQAAQEGVV